MIDGIHDLHGIQYGSSLGCDGYSTGVIVNLQSLHTSKQQRAKSALNDAGCSKRYKVMELGDIIHSIIVV